MIELRTPTHDELPEFWRASERPFHGTVREEHIERDVTVLNPDRCVWAWDGDTIVGTAAAFELDMTLPGERSCPSRASPWWESCRPTGGGGSCAR